MDLKIIDRTMRAILIYIVSLLILATSCSQADQKENPINNAVKVRTHPVEYREYKLAVRATGMLSTATEMKLSFKTGGIISQLNVREGTSVKRGEVLAELDLSEVRAQVNQAHIGLEKARRDLSRAKNLYRDSVVTLEVYQNAESAWEVARSQVQIADFNLEHSRIKAPSDGTIQKILVETSEVIGPGHPAILFASTENDWVVRASLTDKDIVKLSMGDSANVSMDAFPGISFQAEIIELGTIADPVTATYETELLILQSMPGFRTGFISRAEIYPSELKRALVLPMHALIGASDNRAFIYIFKEGKVEKRGIRTGSILGEEVVVLEGLKAGEEVVTEGAKYLREGSEVEVVHTSQTPVE
jgi:RND family efflux transporter MFP subunit